MIVPVILFRPCSLFLEGDPAALGRHGLVAHLAVRVLSLRCLSRLHLLLNDVIPKDLIGAAWIDGAGEYGVFRALHCRSRTPIVGLVGFFSFVA